MDADEEFKDPESDTGFNIDKRNRRSSILKSRKSTNHPSDESTTEVFTSAKASRRVSFANINFIKPFAADPEKTTVWDSTYEEEVNHSDFSKSVDAISPDFLNVTSIGSSETVGKPPIQIWESTTSSKYIQYEIAQGVNECDKENAMPIVKTIISKNETVIYDPSESNMEFTGTYTNGDFKVPNSIVEFVKSRNSQIKTGSSSSRDFEMELTCDFSKSRSGTATVKPGTEPICDDMEIMTDSKNKTIRSADDMEFTLLTDIVPKVVSDEMEFTAVVTDTKLINNVPCSEPKSAVFRQLYDNNLPVRAEDIDMELTTNLATGGYFVSNSRTGKVEDAPRSVNQIECTTNLPRFEQMYDMNVPHRDICNKSILKSQQFSAKKTITSDVQKVPNEVNMEFTSNLPINNFFFVNTETASDGNFKPECIENDQMEFTKNLNSIKHFYNNHPQQSNSGEVKMDFLNKSVAVQSTLGEPTLNNESSVEDNCEDMDYTEMVPNAKQISNIPSSFPVENDFREIPMEFTINLMEPVEIQNSTNFNQQHLERKSNNNFTNVEHFNSRPQTPNEEPDGSSLMTKNINQNDIKKDSARISKKSTEDLRDTNLIPVTNNKTILPPNYFKLDESTPCKITEGDNTNINNTAFNKLKDVTGLGKNFICETNDNLTKNTNKQIADNGNEAPETKNKILYSEPGHLLMKHDNFLPAFKNHLVTPTTSFAMDVSNMSPSIEDTQQLIHATFSKPESINVLLKGQKYPESKVNENKTDSKDDISITHVNELSDTLKETNQLDLLEDQTAKLHTENNKSCWDLTNNSDNILSNITPEIVDVDDSIALGEEASSEQRVSLVNDSIALGEEASSKRQVSLVDDSIASGKEATSEKKDFVLDDSIALGEQVPIPHEMEPESEASLESTLDNVDYQNYTMRSNHILSNIKKHLINIEPDPYFEESAIRCEKICNTFWKDWDQIKSFLEEYRMPTINIVNVEEYFTEKEDDSSRISEGLSSDEFESQRRLSLPDLAPLKSLQERVTEAAERSGKYWQFVKSENDYYYFSCLFRSIRFKVHVHPGLGLVYSIQTENKLEEMSSSFSHYVTKVLELKLKQEHLLSSLGTKFDLLTLLDYVCLCIDEIVSFHKEFDQLGSKYGSSHKLSMHPDNRVTFEILRFNFIIWWTISIDMSLTNLGCKERVSAKCNLNEPVNEEDIKQIAEKCLNGMNFLRNFIEKVDEYVERIGKRILCRRKATRQYMNY